MTEPTARVRPYQPFPSFATWAESAVDPATFRRYAAALAAARDTASEADLREAVRVTTRQAAIDTGAIENLYAVDRGFTFTVATQSLAWDAMHQQIGVQAARYVNDALAAYDYVLDLATGANPVTEQAIREIHSIVCRSQETYRVATPAGPQDRDLPKGAYKTDPNSPYNFADGEVHSYAPPIDTPQEMSRLIAELNGEAFAAADPILQASYAHYAFVCVHPFADGNGRVARALASVYLYRDPGVPLVIFADEKDVYLDVLEAADRGDHAAFIRFIGDRAVDTMAMVTTTLDGGPTSDASEAATALRTALIGRGGLAHEKVDAVADRLREAFSHALQEAADTDAVPPEVVVSVETMPGRPSNAPDGYRFGPTSALLIAQAATSGVGAASASVIFRVAIAQGDADVDDFLVVDAKGSVIVTTLLRNAHPSLTSALRYRLGVVARAQLRSLARDVMVLTQENLERAGYI